jgi:uncharacterized protein (DUF433 family)
MQLIYIYKDIITIEQGKRSGKPCIRGMRIAVADILQWLAAGMTVEEIVQDFPELTPTDVFTALDFASQQLPSVSYLAA